MRKSHFKVTRLKLSELVPNTTQDAMKLRTEIDMAYTEFEAARQIAVEKHRRAVQMQAEAQQAQLEMQRLHQALLLRVGKESTEIASEPVWYVFRKNGDLMFESPYSERTQRNLVRAQFHMLDNQIRNASEGEDDGDLYEEDEGNEGARGASNAS